MPACFQFLISSHTTRQGPQIMINRGRAACAQFARHSRTCPQRHLMQPQSHGRTISTSMISLLPRSSPMRTTKPTSTSSSTTTITDCNTSSSTISTVPPIDLAPDAFEDPEIRTQAEQRWAIGSGSTEFAPIVHRQGRSEIADLAAQMVKTRISNGIIQQKPKKYSADEDKNTHPGTRNRFEKSSPNPHLHKLYGQKQEEAPLWLKHKVAIKEKLQGERWNPIKKVTRQTMEEMRYLRKQFPAEWTTAKLAEHFNVASESVRRIIRTHSSNVIDAERAQEQDAARDKLRKANVKASLTNLAQQKHAEYLERKANREELQKKNAKAPSGRIKLGAPKRTIQ